MGKSIYESVVEGLLRQPRSKWPALAESAQVPLPTLAKIAYRQIEEPGVHKIERLARVLADEAREAA